MANKARERKINETIPDKKGYLDQGFTLHGSPFQKGKKTIIFKQKNHTLLTCGNAPGRQVQAPIFPEGQHRLFEEKDQRHPHKRT